MEDAAAAASRAAITTNFTRRAAMRILPQFLNLVADANANASAISQLLSSVGQPDAAAAAHGRAVLVGLEADRADAVGGELGAAREDGVDEAVGLREGDGGHGASI